MELGILVTLIIHVISCLILSLTKYYCYDDVQSYWEITSDKYFAYIKQYVVGIGPWKDTIAPVVNNYVVNPTDLVARAHAHNLQVHFLFKACFLSYDFMNLLIIRRLYVYEPSLSCWGNDMWMILYYIYVGKIQ